jgi:hypothetical protein
MNKLSGGLLAMCVVLSAVDDDARAQTDLLQKGQDLLGTYGSNLGAQDALSTDEIAAGLKEALRVGSETVVSQLGQTNGFNGDPAVHIPLPGSLDRVKSTLGKVGMSSMLDDLELRLNRAAEAATPKAKSLFLQAIDDMTLDDVTRIYKGPDDAATRYFQSKMSQPLAKEMAPIVDQSLSQVGAVQSYDKAMGRYESIPFVPDAKADLSSYVVEKSMDGIFYYLAQQEAAIRQNPAKRTTELLQKVFGAQ